MRPGHWLLWGREITFCKLCGAKSGGKIGGKQGEKEGERQGWSIRACKKQGLECPESRTVSVVVFVEEIGFTRSNDRRSPSLPLLFIG